jgi:hypothetical protein
MLGSRRFMPQWMNPCIFVATFDHRSIIQNLSES